MNDDFTHEITRVEAQAASAIADVALAKARELRVNPYVMMLAIVTLHEEARQVSGASIDRADELFTHLVAKLRQQTH